MKAAWTPIGVFLSILCFLSNCMVCGRTLSEGITRGDTTVSPPSSPPPPKNASSTGSTTLSAEELFDECVLIKSNTTYTARVMESYLELGYYDILGDVDISFDILPDRYSHNGPLFSIGTEDFQYYEWKTKAFETQYFVIEFVYSAMSLLLKALNEPHMKPMEICRTYPHPYDIGDAQWHHIRVRRENKWSDMDFWYLSYDDIEINQTVTSANDVLLKDRPAYLGGRPGFRSYQFRGVIKNFMIQGERVPLRGRATYGLVEVWHCSAPEVQKFIHAIQNAPTRPPPKYRRKPLPGLDAHSSSRNNQWREEPQPVEETMPDSIY